MPNAIPRVSRADAAYARGLGRAFGGAVIFAFPLIMTMEMWSLGAAMRAERLLLFLVVDLALLVCLSRFAGFEPTSSWAEDVMDGLAAFAVGAIAAAAMLAVLGIVAPGMSVQEIVGKVALQAVPASIGAIVSRKLLGERESDSEKQRRDAGYAGELLLMAAGALFLAFNVAPTEEMVLIAHKMTAGHALALMAGTLALLHAFVYTVGFAGEESAPEGRTFRAVLVAYSMAGYGLALLVSLYVLWTFGRTDGNSLAAIAQMTAVLGFPAALGAAVARLVV